MKLFCWTSPGLEPRVPVKQHYPSPDVTGRHASNSTGEYVEHVGVLKTFF